MKQKLKSLQVRMLLPVIVMTVFVIAMLTTLFSRAYISMILQRDHALIMWVITHVSRDWSCTDHVADHALIT